MTVLTHNTPNRPDVTNIRMIVADDNVAAETLSELTDDTWFEVDAEEVADTEELCGQPYAKLEGHTLIDVRRCPVSLGRIERWGSV